MGGSDFSNSRWVAAGSWIGLAISTFAIPAVVLALVWRNEGSLVRRHAFAATFVGCVVGVVYVSAIVAGLLPAAFYRTSPASWVVPTLVVSLSVCWISAIVGCAFALFGRPESVAAI